MMYYTVYTKLLNSFRKNGRILLSGLEADTVGILLDRCASNVRA